MIAFIGASDSRYIVSEILKNLDEEYDDLSGQMVRLDDLQSLLLAKEYSKIIVDLEFLGEEPQKIAALFRKLREVSTAEYIFIAKGYALDSVLIQSLRNAGFLKYVSAKTIGEQKEQLVDCLNGKDNAQELDRLQQLHHMDDDPVQVKDGASKTVAFCGCQSRIGTTTQAIQFAKYLQFLGLSVCYIEANDNHHIEEIPTLYEIQYHDKTLSMIRFHDLDLYYNVFKIAEIYEKQYDVYIFDFGVFPKNNLLPFLEKNLKVVVSGSKPWELDNSLQVLRELQDSKEIQYIFSFTEREIRDELQKSMKEKQDNTFFCEYSPDMFSLCGLNKAMHMKLFEHLHPESKSLKRRRRFRNR